MRKFHWIAAFALLGAGCDAEVAVEDDGAVPADAGPPQRDCSAAAGPGLVICDDFRSGTATGWASEAGTWQVIDGRYVGIGPPEVDTSECGASLMAASVRDGSELQDVAIHVSAMSRARADKVIVLRATDASNRIEINLRAEPYGDLVVQELVDCEPAFLVEPGQVRVPHAANELVDVEAELIGSHLVVAVDGRVALDRNLDLENVGPGEQGVAIIERSETVFDDVWIYER